MNVRFVFGSTGAYTDLPFCLSEYCTTTSSITFDQLLILQSRILIHVDRTLCLTTCISALFLLTAFALVSNHSSFPSPFFLPSLSLQCCTRQFPGSNLPTPKYL